MHVVVQSCPVYAAQESRTASSTELYYSYERTRTTVTAALCKKLKDLMAEFQALRLRLADEHRQASPVVMHGTCFVCQTCTLRCNRVLLSFFTAVVRIQQQFFQMFCNFSSAEAACSSNVLFTALLAYRSCSYITHTALCWVHEPVCSCADSSVGASAA